MYSEILADEKKTTAAAFWVHARAYFDSLGITVRGVMTDNGACYRSRAFAGSLGPEVSDRFTRACRPQANGRVERFNRTLMTEWAYAQPYLSEQARQATDMDFIPDCNHHQVHTAIGGLTPMQHVYNLTGKYT